MRIESDLGPVIYLDNAATTIIHPDVAEAVNTAAFAAFANPSSLHRPGREARKFLEACRVRFAAAVLGAHQDGWQVVFTGSGTESDGLAVLGAASRKKNGNVVTSGIEHPAVLECNRQLERLGIELRIVPPEKNGVVDPERFAASVDARTLLASLMHVNNEIGTIQPVAETARAVKAENKTCPVHCDAIQSLGKLDLGSVLDCADLVSLSAHKIHGPRGCGALLVRKGISVQPLTGGGGHERGMRPGTENLPAVAGFAEAAERAAKDRQLNAKQLEALRSLLADRINVAVPDARINGDPEHLAPHILSVSVPGLTSQALVRALSDRNICVSEGSACHSRGQKQSHVLSAIGVLGNKGTVRFSLCVMTTERDIDQAAAAYVSVVEAFRI